MINVQQPKKKNRSDIRERFMFVLLLFASGCEHNELYEKDTTMDGGGDDDEVI